MQLVSWNVNGIRAVQRKKILPEWLKRNKPDILCLQETKAHIEQLTKPLLEVSGYHCYFSKPERKGYSGVAIYTNQEPLEVTTSIGKKNFDAEGRVLRADFKDFILFNVYFPNGASSAERQKYKMQFHQYFGDLTLDLYKEGKKVIVTGDVNIAHEERDLWDIKDGEGCSGFLPDEREWLSQYLESGFVDSFRLFEDRTGFFTWWDYRTGARDRNDGWRIDYFLVSQNLKPHVTAAKIHSRILGSDHCPISIELNL